MRMPERCMCGDPYCKRCFPTALDYEPFMESALELVVETIMLFGEYPQPRKQASQVKRRQFDLWDWLVDNVSEDDRNQFVFAMTTNYGNHDSILLDWNKKIEKALILALEDSDIVRDKAEQLAQEEMEAQR